METSLPAWALLSLCVAGVLAGFINVVAGGGSLLTMPLMIFLGLPEGAANGTARVAILVQNFTAVARYRRAGRLDTQLALKLSIPAVVGAMGGAWVATAIGDEGFRAVLSWVMLGCALLVVFNPAMGSDAQTGMRPRLDPARLWPLLLIIGFYGGLVQAGVGYLILFGFTYLLRLELVEANIMKVVVVAAYTPLCLALFVSQGMVEWVPGLCLAVGQAAGAWLGAAAALKRGAQLIRVILAVVVSASAAKLMGVF